MKVLFLAPYIYEDSIAQFQRNKTGFGMMVNDIIKSVSKKSDVYLLTHIITEEKVFKDATILKHSWKDIFLSMSFKYLLRGIKCAAISRQKIKGKLRYIFYYVDSGYLKKIINEINPEIIHIHGIGYSTKPYIDICEELGIPYVVTLHGLIGFGNGILATKQDKELEREFLLRSEINNIPVTLISRGMKKRVLDNYNLKNGENIKVITNGTNVEILNCDFKTVDIRLRYNIPKNNKIILCVGNLCQRKNQIQLVRSFYKINDELRKKITIMFLGVDKLNGAVQRLISESGSTENIICCGFVDKQEIPSFFAEATLNVVASLDEGFGLSVIEGFVYGVPTVTFFDLDAVEDLYDDRVMLLVNERSDEALAKGIERALMLDWDKSWIMEYSRNFSLEKMGDEYNKFYCEVIKKVER